MFDISFVRENSEAIKKDLTKRGDSKKIAWVDEVIEKHDEWKSLKKKNDELRKSRNTITREINELRKAGKDFKAKVKEAKELPGKIDASDKKVAGTEERIHFILQRLPNILHESVPVAKDESGNKEVKKWGKIREIKEQLPHGELLEEKNLADFTRSTKISGSGFYFLKGDMVRLEQALINFALDVLHKKGFQPITTPFMMRREPYESVVALQDFEDVMYKMDGDDLHLIATSEHPLAAMHSGEVLDKKDLPLKYAGLSTNFRKEIGSHGVDTRGLFRVHQFNKVEMFVFSLPEESWKIHEELLSIAEEITQALKIPYRVVNICSGDIGAVAAKKYDIEAWFPRQKTYRELISCSNCTVYQSTGLNIRYADGEEKMHVHTLNSTAIALSRTLAAITENYQNSDGSIEVPTVLQKYMGKKVIGKKI